MNIDLSSNGAENLTIGVALKQGFFANEGAQKRSTISAATDALRAATDDDINIVYLVSGQPRLPVHALLLPGGDDIDPSHYRRPDLLPQVQDTDYKQDAFELDLARAALAEGLPVLGLCRGFQILNVARGGTLIPRLPNADHHFRQAAEEEPSLRAEPVHSLRVAPASKLWGVVQGESTIVNSIHRSGIDQLGHGLRATAWAEDGIIEAFEAVEADESSWQHAVLFHPEELCRRDPSWLRLFRTFLEAAQSRRSRAEGDITPGMGPPHPSRYCA